MDSSAPLEGEWTLARPAFAKLLGCLDPDPELAGEKYEALRLMLVKFFDWRGALYPEECADETFNRVARKIDSGEAIRDLASYCHGVARLIFLETLKRPEHDRVALDNLDLVAIPAEETNQDDQRQICFNGCIHRLPEESRAVILQYYQGERRSKIDHRQALAGRLGIPLNALRKRAQRIRLKLERCIHACLKKRKH